MSQQCHSVEVREIDLNSNIKYGACQSYTGNVDPQHLVAVKKDFWVAYPDSFTGGISATGGNITKYSHKGKFEFLVNSANSPRGIARNCSSRFGGYKLLVDTEEGTIEGYNPVVNLTNTVQVLQSTGAFYTDLDLSKDKLFAANFATGTVDVYNGSSTPFPVLAPITDADLIANQFKAYAVKVYKKHIYVAYAYNSGDNNPLTDPLALHSGYVDVFKLDGTCMKRLINRTGLNIPTQILVSECGCYLYIANKGDGTISIYDRKCGTYLGQFKDCCANQLIINNLNALTTTCSGGFAFTAGSPDVMDVDFVAITTFGFGLLGLLNDCCEKKCKKACSKSSSSSSSSSDCCRK